MEAISQATALYLAVLTQLRREWTPVSEMATLRTQLVTLGVSVAPSVTFRTKAPTSETVEIRGIAIGDKLFVHFVSKETATRLDLLLGEYTKHESAKNAPTVGSTHSKAGPWFVNIELLQWRLERNVLAVFRAEQPNQVDLSAGAELGRLPEPILLRIAPFLTGKEYCGMTQTNKFLHEYADKPEIWSEYVLNEFPHAMAAQDEDATKALFVKFHNREKRRRAAIHNVWESLPPPPGVHPDDPFGRPRPFIRPPEPRPAFFDEMF